jgi:hypothetical protein
VAARRAASVAGQAGDGTVGGRADLPAGEKPDAADAARQKAEKLDVDLPRWRVVGPGAELP